MKATDKDSGVFGMMKYRIFDEENNAISPDELPGAYFTIAEDNGILRIQKSLLHHHEQPLKFYVEAIDNNGLNEEVTHKTRARVVVNVIADVNRMTLFFSDSAPKDVRRHSRALEELLSEKAGGLMVGIEKFSNRKIVNENGSLVELPDATDVW
jgi:protocadherin-15